jgi:hypothetical protein
MVMDTAGSATKNDCAGEAQQQITRPELWLVVSHQLMRIGAVENGSSKGNPRC